MSLMKDIGRSPTSSSSAGFSPPKEEPLGVSEGDGTSFAERMDAGGESSDVQTSSELSGGGKGSSGHSGGGQQDGQGERQQADLEIYELESKKEEAAKQERMSLHLQQAMFGRTNKVIAQAMAFEIQNRTIPEAMLQKIVADVNLATQVAGGVEFQFTLKGDVLGGMQLNVRLEGGAVIAEFLPTNSEIQKLLANQIFELKQRLQLRGLKVSQLIVRDPAEEQRERMREQHQKDREQSGDPPSSESEEGPDEEA